MHDVDSLVLWMQTFLDLPVDFSCIGESLFDVVGVDSIENVIVVGNAFMIDASLLIGIVDVMNEIDMSFTTGQSAAARKVFVILNDLNPDATSNVDLRDDAKRLLFSGKEPAAHDKSDAVTDVKGMTVLILVVDGEQCGSCGHKDLSGMRRLDFSRVE